jgi:hypothetical protein
MRTGLPAHCTLRCLLQLCSDAHFSLPAALLTFRSPGPFSTDRPLSHRARARERDTLTHTEPLARSSACQARALRVVGDFLPAPRRVRWGGDSGAEWRLVGHAAALSAARCVRRGAQPALPAPASSPADAVGTGSCSLRRPPLRERRRFSSLQILKWSQFLSAPNKSDFSSLPSFVRLHSRWHLLSDGPLGGGPRAPRLRALAETRAHLHSIALAAPPPKNRPRARAPTPTHARTAARIARARSLTALLPPRLSLRRYKQSWP